MRTRRSIHGGGRSRSKTRGRRLVEATARSQAKALRIHVALVTLLCLLLSVLALDLGHDEGLVVRFLDHLCYRSLRRALYLARLPTEEIISGQTDAHLDLSQYSLQGLLEKLGGLRFVRLHRYLSTLLLLLLDELLETVSNWFIVEDLQIWRRLGHFLVVSKLLGDRVLAEVDIGEPRHPPQVLQLLNR